MRPDHPVLARAAAGERVELVQLVYVGTAPTPQRWALGGRPIRWDGHVWAPVDALLGDIEDAASGLNNVTLTLPGVTPSQVAFAFEDLDGAPLQVWDAWLAPEDPTTAAHVVLGWAGECDTPGWQDGAESVVIINATHAGAVALRPKPLFYTDDDQRRLYPGDASLDSDPATDAAPIKWPAASYYRKE